MEESNVPKVERPTPRNDDVVSHVFKQMSAQERYALADFWESDSRKALEKLLGLRQLQLAQSTLKSSPDHYYTREMRGRALELANISALLSRNLKDVNKSRAEKTRASS